MVLEAQQTEGAASENRTGLMEARERLAARRDELIGRLQEALEAAAFSNRLLLTLRHLPQVAKAEADAFLDFLETGAADRIREQGAKRAEEGLGEPTILRLTTTLRQFCRDDPADEALRAADAYADTLLEGFMQGQEALVLREQEQIRKALQRVASRYALQLATAAEISRSASSILDPDELLPQVVNLIHDRFNFYYVGLFLLDESGEHAVLHAGTGEAGRQMLEMVHKLEVGGTSMIGWCTAHGKARIALDVGREAIRFDNPLLPETRSEMALPLISRGRVIGAMTIQSAQSAAFSEEDINVLQTMADQLANVIENARLFRRTEESLEEMSRLHQHYLRQEWQKHLADEEARTRAGYMYDRGTVRPAGDVWVPEIGLAVRRGETIALSEMPVTQESAAEAGAPLESPPAQAALAVPLTLRGQVIGALDFYETEKPRRWTSDDIALVEAVSEQVALALESARLFGETQKSAQQMQTLYETSRVLSSSLEEEPLVRAILEAVYRALGCEYVLISTVDEAAKTIGTRHGIWRGEFDGFPEWMQAAQYPLDHPNILADVYRTGRTEIIGEWDERFNREVWDKFGHARFQRVFMPIKMRDRVIGVVEVGYDKREKGDIGEEEVQMLAAFMDQAAVALENARLFEEARVHAEELAALNELGQALTTRLDVEGVLDEAYRGASRLLDTTNFYVALYDPDKDEATFALDVSEGEVRKPYTTRQAGQGLTEYVIRNRRPLLIGENLPERLAELGIELIGQTALSWLGVPLLVGDRVLGVIAVQSYAVARAYDEHDRDLLTAIASQTAIALQNAHLFAEAQRRATQLAAAAEVARDATAILDTDQLLDQTVHLISEQFGFYHAGVFLLDEQSEYAVLRAASSEGGRRMLERGHRLRIGEVGIVGYAAGTGEHRIALDVGEDAAHFAHADLPDTRSEMALPLKVQERVIGVLDVQSTQEAAFSEEDVAVLQTMADQLATAIANARLFQEVRADVTRRAVINEVLQAAASSLDPQELLERAGEAISRQMEMPCAILGWDATAETLRAVMVRDPTGADATPPEPTTITPEMAPAMFQAIHTQELQVLSDVPARVRGAAAQLAGQLDLLDAACAALVSRDRVLGLLVLSRQRGHPPLDEGELSFVQIIAANLSVVMENARLYQEAVRRARRERLAREITAKIVGSTELDTILKTTAQELGKALGTSHALIRLGRPPRPTASAPPGPGDRKQAKHSKEATEA